MSLTNDVTILPNAAPITIPTAMSTTLPRMANSLNSLSIRFSSLSRATCRQIGCPPEMRAGAAEIVALVQVCVYRCISARIVARTDGQSIAGGDLGNECNVLGRRGVRRRSAGRRGQGRPVGCSGPQRDGGDQPATGGASRSKGFAAGRQRL